jgi:hypothetical protein
LADCKAVSTPLDPGAVLVKGGIPAADRRYAEIVGCLLYITFCTCPDIQFASSALARHMAQQTVELLNHAQQAFRYLPVLPILRRKSFWDRTFEYLGIPAKWCFWDRTGSFWRFGMSSRHAGQRQFEFPGYRRTPRA